MGGLNLILKTIIGTLIAGVIYTIIMGIYFKKNGITPSRKYISGKEIRGTIYDILATYNIILLDKKCLPVLGRIKEKYKDLEIPNLEDKEFKYNLLTLFKNEWNISLEEIIEECKNDGIFLDVVNYLR